MLPWKLRKRQILPVNQNLSSVYFSLAKFQLVNSNFSLAMTWHMTYIYSETAKTVFSHLTMFTMVLSSPSLSLSFFKYNYQCKNGVHEQSSYMYKSCVHYISDLWLKVIWKGCGRTQERGFCKYCITLNFHNPELKGWDLNTVKFQK